MTDLTARNYLRDLTQLIAEQAFVAKIERDEATPDGRDYANGRLMAYHEIVSLMQQQAIAFRLDQDVLGISHITPERDLI